MHDSHMLPYFVDTGDIKNNERNLCALRLSSISTCKAF